MATRFETEIVLERMAAGEFAANIALDYGVTKQAVSKRLLRHSREQYRQAMERGAAVRLLRLLRRSRDYRDVPRKALLREKLYLERQAPQVLKTHADLIQTAFWRYCQTRWPACRLQRPQSQAVTDEILAMERWYQRLNAEREQAES